MRAAEKAPLIRTWRHIRRSLIDRNIHHNSQEGPELYTRTNKLLNLCSIRYKGTVACRRRPWEVSTE